MHQFANGLTFIHKRTTANQIVGISCIAMSGSALEEDREAGLTNLCLNVMQKGTTSLDAQEIAERIEELGISLGHSTNEDYCSWSLVSTKDDLEAALDLFADIILNPSFDPDEFENERKQVLAAIRMEEDSTFQVTYKEFRGMLYSGHPYGRPVEGTPETLAALSPVALADLHRTRLVPSNMILAIVGDLDEKEARRLIEKRLGGPCPLPPRRATVSKDFLPRAQTREISKKAEQAFVCVGYVTAPIQAADYPALRLASSVLGEGMSARLFRTLRDKQGLAYAVGSMHKARRQHGHLVAYIGTDPSTMDRARNGMIEEVNRLKREPVPDDELQRAKNYTVGRYLMGHQTNADQAFYLAYWQAMGMGADFDQAWPGLMEKVTQRDILRVANKYFLEPTVAALRPPAAGIAAPATPAGVGTEGEPAARKEGEAAASPGAERAAQPAPDAAPRFGS